MACPLSFRKLLTRSLLWFCAVCLHHFKPLETCISRQHDYHWHDGVKRFFKCPCGNRTISLDRLPRSTAGMRIPGILGPIGLLNLFAIPGWCCFLETSDGPWPERVSLVLCLLTAPGYPQLLLEGRDPPPFRDCTPSTKYSAWHQVIRNVCWLNGAWVVGCMMLSLWNLKQFCYRF